MLSYGTVIAISKSKFVGKFAPLINRYLDKGKLSYCIIDLDSILFSNVNHTLKICFILCFDWYLPA